MPVTLKRKAPEADIAPRPSSAIPSTLPPSVEEAYRRKCIQLKNRTNEVEDANDAARLRLARIKRQVEKLRIERAFLLEQLSKRTSTNVEDSDGSPSPPPTNLDGLAELMVNPRKPKDKPLRTKRGHRKSMAVDIESKAAGASFNSNAPLSPTSESARANGIKVKVPADAFEVFCDENRDALEAKKKDDDANVNIEDELARLWKEIPEAEKEEFEAKFEKAKADAEEKNKKAEEEEATSALKKQEKEDKEDKEYEQSKDDKDDNADKPEDSDKPQTQDEDVEMGNYDTEDQDTQADKADE